MPRFPSAEEAFEWAEKTLAVREGGRTNTADDAVGAGGPGKDYAILDAIWIRRAAQRACQGERMCPTFRSSCFVDWYIPDPLVEQPRRSDAEKSRIHACVALFEDELWDAGFLSDRPRRYGL